MTRYLKPAMWFLPVFAGFLVLFATMAMGQDFSKSYRYGGRVHIPVENPPAEREIFDVGAGVEAGGVLGCDGFSMDAIVDQQIGGLGISDLSEELAEAAKTRLFRESMTRVLANPQVASVFENMQSFAHARISLLQERCNANEIFADATNKRLQADAMQRCVDETQNMEACQDADTIREYMEETIQDDKWTKTMHDHLCPGGIEENCDWLTLIPNRATVLEGNQSKGYTPPLLNGRDMTNIANSYAVDIINERVRAAEAFVSQFGYARAMEAALHNEPGLPDDIQEELDQGDADIAGAKLYTLHDHTNSKACKFSLERGMQTTMADVMSPADGGVFPISGASISDANISSLFGVRTRPCEGCSTFHEGVDFAYGAGAGVVSSVSGLVRQATYNSCGGNQVVIEDADGTLVKYLHLDQINENISPGVTVGAGTSLGAVGSTGACTTGPHLHFSVEQNGVPIDPLAWLGGNDNAMARAMGEEDNHGLESVAAARLAGDPVSEFVVDNHKKAAQLGARLASTIRCNIDRSIHPQVFVNIAVQPGSLGPFSRGDIVNKDMEEQEIFDALAAGDKGSITHGLGRVFGHHAAVTAYSAAINEMTLRLASVKTGKDGMNKPLYRQAQAELSRLKFERGSIVNDYNLTCMATRRVSQAIEAREERLDNMRRQPYQLKGVRNEPLDCKMFEHISDDWIDGIRRFAQETDEDVEKMRQRQRQ